MWYRAANSSWVSPSARRSVLVRGTGRADSRSSGLIGRASGSAKAAASTSSSVIVRRRSQSVRSGSGVVVPSGMTLTSDPSRRRLATIVGSLLMPIRSSGRDDPNALTAFGIDDREKHAVDHPGNHEACFAVIHPGIEPVKSEGIAEYATGSFKSDGMLSAIALRFCLVPLEFIIHECTVYP